MTNEAECPLCLNLEGDSCRRTPGWDRRDISRFECGICGAYQLTYEAHRHLGAGDDGLDHRKPTPQQRAILSHKVRMASSKNDSEPPTVTDDMLMSWLSDGTLPSPAMQAENLIRFVGDEVLRSGEKVTILPRHVCAVIGTRSYRSAIDLAKELSERKLLRLNPQGAAGIIAGSPHPVSIPANITLSLDGWERYESGKRGEFVGDNDFIAMQFDDPDLDSFVRDVVKPAVKRGIGYDLVDMRDVARAGVIDDIMRVQIRDAAFVIADLTHDNHGAYWEAGYAEGLGKPVVYICEKEKFEKQRTHFDTNHCTTVPWSKDDPEGFDRELVATLRRSLGRSP